MIVALGACMQDSTTDQVEEVNACSLLSREDIALTINGVVGDSYRQDTGWLTSEEQAGVYSSTCVWPLSTGNVGDLEYVILMAMTWPQDKSPDHFLQEFRTSAAHGIINQEPVPLKLGDSALWWGDGVAVTKNQISIGVSTRLAGEKERRRTAEEALASIVVSRL